jgi:hypothetical protein
VENGATNYVLKPKEASISLTENVSDGNYPTVLR